MADRSKVRWSQLKVGIVALASCLILAVLVFLLTSSRGLFRRDVLLFTYMDDASGMGDGSPVRLNGITVGYLDKLELTNSRDPKRTVRFDMRVQAQYLNDIPVDSVAGISAANLLGDKFVNITKGKSPQHVQPDAELASLQAQDIPELMAQSANLLQSFQGVVTRVDNLLAGVEAGKGNIGKLIKDEQLYNTLNSIASEGNNLLSDVRTGNGTLSKLLYDDSLYQELRSPVKRIDSILADLQAGQGTAGKLMQDPALFNDAHQLLGEMQKLVADVNAGKGTAGKLLKDEQLHQRIQQLVAKLSGTLDKIDAGQGSLGQFIVNPQLYEALTGVTREFQSLAKDMRANPKKFLTIRLVLF
ncbi:MAG: MlaD family protein [Acidobacteriia bacterium]|nr:MlaD family protein [Terriglobia bacterium]